MALLPSDPQNGLPALTSNAVLEALPFQTLQVFHDRYYPSMPVPQSQADRILAIKMAIGCRSL
ncbi:hypothetical protein BDN72DRAFT_849119 [Pluteus cervinus]|uniref:Uncharacterized protein n=1 Tax=Pluteus cervinus TaxID=181527 RepID=A0ACD3A8K8_9AGAR|nr:hypothetical protein BDN72DRAFT_849119 [Pluteus cervinus]